jgi:endonuclease/exonuclease/phosphatase family metal-dependent hydrolase
MDSSSPSTAPDSLKVMNWNIKFGGGRIDFFFDCYGDRVLMTEAEVVKNLEGLALKINQYDPDILVLQEVDIASDRSAQVDQLQWLLDHTALKFGAYASQWHAYVPSHGLGRMNDGNAVLSKYPITQATRVALQQSMDQDWLTRFFYLRRNILDVTIALPNDTLSVLATHLDAYSKDSTRWFQLQTLYRLAETKQHPMIIAGDLNTVPPGSKKLKGFDDSVCKQEEFVMDDYTPEQTWLLPLYKVYQEAIPLGDYHADETRYYSHTVNGRGFWNRRLDYLFTNRSWSKGLVHQNRERGGMETMPLSDHAPVTATLWLRK